MLVRILLEGQERADAETTLRQAFGQTEAVAERQGRGKATPHEYIETLGNAGVRARALEPIERAERWARELGANELVFAVAHMRGELAEQNGEIEGAIAEYVRLVESGSHCEATFTRAMILLERTKQYSEALTIARRSLQIHGSAALEQRTRGRIQRLEGHLAPRGAKRAKTAVPPFLLRGGADLLEYLRDLQVSGGVKQLLQLGDGGLAVLSSGPHPAIWVAPADLDGARRVRDAPPRSELIGGPATSALLIREGVGDAVDTALLLSRTGLGNAS